jgi:hypothetical protein
MQIKHFFLLIIGVCLLLTVNGWGYVLGPEMLLSLMSREIGQPGGFTVKQTIRRDLMSCDDDSGVGVREIAWYNIPGQFRVEAVSEEGKTSVYVTAAERAVTILNQTVLSTDENSLMLYTAPLLFRDWETLSERLSDLGVAVSVTSLGRLDRRVAFVVGAHYPDVSVSQFWVDKETFLPWRLLVKTSEDDTIEVVYGDWRKEDRFSHPHRIDIYRNNTLHHTICCQGVTRTRSFADDFFNIDHLQSQYPSVGEDPFDPAEKPLDDIEQTIDDFRKLYQ